MADLLLDWLVGPLIAVRGEWLKRGLRCRKLMCSPRFHVDRSEERLMSVGVRFSRDQVVIAVDPHKGSWTAAAVDASLQPLAGIRCRSAARVIGRCAGLHADGPTSAGRSKGPPGWEHR